MAHASEIDGSRRDTVAAVRRFNRFYTRAIGALDKAYLGGPYTLADCWARHEAALWELGTIAAQWNRVFNRKRPDLALALEFFDRWLPDAMRRVEDATRICSPRHNPT